jgi:hypothetical protein
MEVCGDSATQYGESGTFSPESGDRLHKFSGDDTL